MPTKSAPDFIPIPSDAINAEPLVSFCVNRHWLPAIEAMVQPFSFPERWGGTLEENRFAREQVRQLMALLQVTEDCTMGECCHDEFPPIFTTDSDGADLLVSFDNGVTNQIYTQDERLNIFQVPPPVPIAKDNKCDAASAVVAGLKDLKAGISTQCATATTVVGFITGIVTLIAGLIGGPIGAALGGLLGLIFTAVWNMGCESYNALFTDERWNTVLCIIYCRMDDGGHITAQGWHNIIQDIRAQLPGYPSPNSAAANYSGLVVSAGYLLMNAWAYNYAADPDADCSACDCPICGHDWDASILGTETARGIHPPGTFILSGSVDVSGGQWIEYTAEANPVPPPNFAVVIKSPNPDSCCRVFYEVQTGSVSTAAWIACGNPQDPAFLSFSFLQGSFANYLELADASTFTVRVSFLSP